MVLAITVAEVVNRQQGIIMSERLSLSASTLDAFRDFSLYKFIVSVTRNSQVCSKPESN